MNDFIKVMKEIEESEEQFWNSLSHEEKLCCFNSVCRRIYQGEIINKKSYRGLLYDVFGFDTSSYARAQMAGYLAIHNSIFTMDDQEDMYIEFAKFLGLSEEEAHKKTLEHLKRIM